MKKFQMTNFDMPNNISSLKHALKSVTGLADVGVPCGDSVKIVPWEAEFYHEMSEHVCTR